MVAVAMTMLGDAGGCGQWWQWQRWWSLLDGSVDGGCQTMAIVGCLIVAFATVEVDDGSVNDNDR